MLNWVGVMKNERKQKIELKGTKNSRVGKDKNQTQKHLKMHHSIL